MAARRTLTRPTKLKRGPKRGAAALKVLTILGEMALGTADVIGALIENPYGASRRRLTRTIAGYEADRARREALFREQQKYHQLLHRLAKDGLIVRHGNRQQSRWHLTRKGKEERDACTDGSMQSPTAPRTYAAHENATLTIVMFDIPERERRNREWLRVVLARLQFSMLQKSVWAGYVRLPEDFLEDLKRLKLTEYVEIFSVTKTGSLERLHVE